MLLVGQLAEHKAIGTAGVGIGASRILSSLVWHYWTPRYNPTLPYPDLLATTVLHIMNPRQVGITSSIDIGSILPA